MIKEKGLVFNELICKPYYTNAVEVKLYDTHENMFLAVNEWNKKNKNKYTINNDFDALTLENLPNDIKKSEETEFLIFSTIFLSQKKLTYGILLHECGHATFNLFRNILRFNGKFNKINGTGDDEEEIFCYTQEGVFVNLLNMLHIKGIEINGR